MLTRLLIFFCLFALGDVCHGSDMDSRDKEKKNLFILLEKYGNDPDVMARIHEGQKTNRGVFIATHKTISFQFQNPQYTTKNIDIDFQDLEKNDYLFCSQNQNRDEAPIVGDLFKAAIKCQPKETVKDPENDERKLIDNPVSYPLCQACGKLTINFPSKQVIGTGFLISPNCVLTAGHCLFDKNYGGGAKEIIFYYSSEGRWEAVKGKSGFIVSGWKEDTNDACDYGMIVLSKPVNINKYMGLSFKSDEYLKDLYVNITGFPTEKQNSHDMYTAWGIIKKIRDSFLIRHNVDSSEGQSGSPIWILEEKCSQPYSVGIHTQGFRGNRKVNTGVKVDNIHFQNIMGWIKHENSNKNGLVY
jgi:glutamyl endopeptidase